MTNKENDSQEKNKNMKSDDNSDKKLDNQLRHAMNHHEESKLLKNKNKDDESKGYSDKECSKKNCDKECPKEYCNEESKKKESDNNVVAASQNYKGSNESSQKEKSENNKKENSKHKDTVIFDSLVESERNYIQKKLKCKVYDDYYETSNICINFYRWIISQFEKLKYKEPSSTMISDLEYIQTQTDKEDLFIKEGSQEKTEKYLNNIESANLENYEDDIDVYALAAACRNDIKTNLIFFTSELESKLVEVYKMGNKAEDKRFVIERTPFLMNYRSVFKIIKEIIRSQDSKQSVTMEKSVNLWADVICKFEAPKETRVQILQDLLKVEFDHIPINYYE